ncbi:MAG TPA: SRPBCC family protein [Streptosporangiaceae bacterium]|nr:SRPBCC family protein [Streptosporangiaceae bacterium]
MTEQAAATGSLSPVRCALTVPLPPERAFALFTEGYFSWWPHGHHLGKADLADVVLEPRTGGRYYERGVDGSECDWGAVLACDPPHRIVVSWQINANDDDWYLDPDPAHASEIEVTFTGQPDGQTRVELEHRNFERHGTGGAGIHAGVSASGGWGMILASYAKVAATA